MNNKLIILVGNIGSGKSTCARELARKGFIVVSRDSLRYMIGGGDYIFDEELEPIIWELELKIIEEFLVSDKNVVVDEVGMSIEQRRRYLDMVTFIDIERIAIEMPILTMEESIIRRLISNHGNTDKDTWKNVWKKFNRMYEKPTIDEGFDRVIKYDKNTINNI